MGARLPALRQSRLLLKLQRASATEERVVLGMDFVTKPTTKTALKPGTYTVQTSEL